MKARQTAISFIQAINIFIEKQAANMVPVNHVQSCACHVIVLADAGSLPQSNSNSMLTAGDLMATGVTVNKQFLNITYRTFTLA